MNSSQTTHAAAALGLTSPLRRWPRLVTCMFAVAFFAATASVFAVGGDFQTTDFAAAAPFTYTHSTGGGAYNDRTVGDFNDITEQLEGAQFSCGDIVTYLAQIDMEDVTVDANQSVRMSFNFLANSTGQAGAAHSAVVDVSINYGLVENGDDGTGSNPGAGFFGLDSGISDDGGSTVTLISTGLTGPLFQSGSELELTVEVDDLEAGETVVLRIDTRLACDPGSNPTGNLQGQLVDVIALPSGDAAGSGAQTIPFLRVGDIAGAGEPLIQTTKTVTTETGTCGVDDVEELTVFAGETVKYCYWVDNPGTADLFDVEVTDDAGTPGDGSDDFTVSLTGLADLDGDADLGDLASGGSAHGEALVTFDFAQTVINTADGVGNNGRSGGNFAELTDSDIATVIVEGVPNSPPVANDDADSTPEETPVTIDATANDTDVDGNLDPTTANTGCIGCSLPSNGTLVNNGDGTFTYTPDPGFTGTDTFVYEVCDTEGLCDTATVTITVTPVNDPPVAEDDNYSTPEDTTLTVNAPGILGNDSDPDGDTLSLNVLTNPSNGSLTQNADGSFDYTPNADFCGTDSYTYEVCDPSNLCDPATVTIDVVCVNDPPDAVDDSASVNEDDTVAIPVLGNDSDPEGDPLTVTSVTDPPDGTAEINPDGTIQYTPDADFCGTDTFQYTISDGNGGTDTATVTVDVACVNDGPDAANDSYNATEDTVLNIPAPGVLNNDTDPDGDPLTVVSNTQPANGSVVQNPDGSFDYTPNADFCGTDTYTYTISDGNGGSDTATVTIDVACVNDPPDAVDDSASVDEDGTVDIPVLGNDSDPEGDPLTVTDVSDPPNGTATINPDGTINYTPDPDFCGQDTFTYTISDGNGGTDTATVTVDVACVNDPPVANDDQETTDEDMAVVIDVQENDSAGPSNEDPSLTTTTATDPPNGSVEINPDGTITYTPDPNFSGTDTFDYTVCDSDNACDTATVTVVVNPLNDPPVANYDSASTPEDTPVGINAAANDTDVDGNLDPTSATVLEGPSDGSVTNNGDGTFTYTPDADFCGQDTFTYQICDDGQPDGTPLCDMATVTIDVACVNDAPVAVDDSYNATEDTPLTIDAPGVLVNDSDVDGDTLTVASNTQPANGTVTQNPDGSLTYTPNADFCGIDTYDYTISDGNGGSDTATVTIDVACVNDPPDAVDDSASVNEDGTVAIPVLGNDSDPENDPLTVTDVGEPGNGTATINPDGTVQYTPEPDFCGTDTFDYTISDGNGGTDTATVTVDVVCVNDPPEAVNDSYNAIEDELLVIPAPGILSNDSDIDGDTLTVVSNTDPTNGTLTQNPDGSFSYLPDENFCGSDSYDYTISDGNGGTASATVFIDIACVNDPPTAEDDAASVNEDEQVSFNVLPNDSDPDGNLDPSSTNTDCASCSLPSNGTLTNDGNGNFTYTPVPDFFGTDTFVYEVCDTDGACDTATVTITVVSVPDPPIATDDFYVTPQDTTLSVSAADGVILGTTGPDGADSDPDTAQADLTVEAFDSVSAFGGTVVVYPDGSFDYTPAPGFAGFDTFDYTVCDPEGACDTATVTIEVTAKNGRSISVSWGDWILDQPYLGGTFHINNQSDGFDVQLQGYELIVQYRTSGPGKKEWIDVAVTGCTFAPATPTMLVDELWVNFSDCELQAAIPAGSTVRVTAVVGIYGHKDRGKNKQTFLSRLSQAIP